jgi:tetratricopeptide (TPR) repeat protein
MRKMGIGVLLLSFTMIAVAGTNAQSTEGAETESRANAAYTAKNWAEAATLYEQLVALQPDSFRDWYRLGVSLQSSGHFQKALDAFEKAQAKGLPVYIAEYSIAAAYASMGQAAKAMEHLAAAVKQGYGQPDQMTSDPALQSIRGDARFAALLQQAKRNQAPCAYAPENRQFDFWVGDWDVVMTHGNSPAGISHIERVIGDCVIWENWTSLGNTGYSGKSYNIYNPSFKRWEQFWVDNLGGIIHFYGGLQEGAMDFYTDEIPQPDGTNLKRHLQFFHLGADKVRQFSQGSSDGGKSWSVEYDFTYNRKK